MDYRVLRSAKYHGSRYKTSKAARAGRQPEGGAGEGEGAGQLPRCLLEACSEEEGRITHLV